MAWVTGCGTPVKSVADFGTATEFLAEDVAATAEDSTTLCEHKQTLQIDEQAILGEMNAEQAVVELKQDKCKRFETTAAFYAALARQLAAFGLAMNTLAQESGADYTAQLTQLGGGAAAFGLDPAYQKHIKTAAGLTAKLLSWASKGYASAKIRDALLESEQDVSATLGLLAAVLEVYAVQLEGYEQLIEQVSKDEDFATAREGEAPGLREARARAQVELVKVHMAHARERARLIDISRSALDSVKTLHVALVSEAKGAGEFDVPELKASARTLAAKVSEFRRLTQTAAH